MTKTRFDGANLGRHTLDEEPTSDTGFLLGISTFGLGMLALLAVLAVAGELGLGGVLPFFVVPSVLLVGSALVLWRWAAAEAQAAALREALRAIRTEEGLAVTGRSSKRLEER
jgi:hypothetical protein